MQGAKWPIVLTANSLPTWLHGPRYKVVEMTRPPTTHLATLLSAVWAGQSVVSQAGRQDTVLVGVTSFLATYVCVFPGSLHRTEYFSKPVWLTLLPPVSSRLDDVAAEGLPPLPPSSFLSLARAKACDVRASLMALQLWACRPEVRKAAQERSR